MSLALDAGRPEAPGAAARRTLTASARAAGRLRWSLALVATAALWIVFHPYTGIVGDASIYLGRALADLDPAGIGRDIAFRFDGQSRFSLFPLLVRPLVAGLGAERASLVIALAGAASFFAAAVALARALAPPRVHGPALCWAIVAALAVLPATYGQTDVFRFGETSALPRPFAEAAVLGALAALLVRRGWLAAALLALAALVHPIMAAGGVGAALLVPLSALARGRRPAAAALLALAAAALAVVLAHRDIPPFASLLRGIDDAWYGYLVERSAHLFPTLWRAESFAPILAQLAAVLVAVRPLPQHARALLLAVAASALLGLAASALGGDTLRLLLVLQVQPWRATWLLAVVGGACLVLAAPALWREGPRGRLVLLLLALAWFVASDLAVAAAMSAAAVALRYAPARVAVTDRLLALAAASAAVLALVSYGGLYAGYLAYLRTLPAGLPWDASIPLHHGLHMVPIALGGAVLMRLPARRRRGLPLLAGAAALLALLACASFDQRPASRVAMEAGQAPDAFTSVSGDRPGDVLWLEGRAEPWFLLHRPQWMSAQQAVGIVFSRELATEWRRRAEALVAAGLIRRSVFTPWDPIAVDDRPRPTAASLAAFCRRPDAPAAVVMPIRDDRPALAIPGSARWTIAPEWVVDTYAVPEWHRVDGFQAVRCAGASFAAAAGPGAQP